jgi:hypothetical protein
MVTRIPNRLTSVLSLALVLGTLVFFSVRLYKRLHSLNKVLELRSKVVPNDRFDDGIDINGSHLRILPPSDGQRTLTFMLRGESLVADLAFWNSVASGLEAHNVRLLGYCDSSRCAENIRSRSGRLNFPIVFYANADTANALFEMDDKGAAVLQNETWLKARAIPWRGPNSLPNDVIREVLL